MDGGRGRGAEYLAKSVSTYGDKLGGKKADLKRQKDECVVREARCKTHKDNLCRVYRAVRT